MTSTVSPSDSPASNRGLRKRRNPTSSSKTATGTSTSKNKQSFKFDLRNSSASNRSSSELDSDLDEEEHGSRRKSTSRQKPIEQIKRDYSGYSSSSENSDYEIISNEKNQDFEESPLPLALAVNAAKCSPRLRKRASAPRKAEDTPLEEIVQQKQPASSVVLVLCEKVEHPIQQSKTPIALEFARNESDISLDTEETSDEFWKSGNLAEVVTKKKHSTIDGVGRKKRSSYKLVRWFELVCDFFREWRRFKSDHEDQVRDLLLVRNQCMLGLFVVFIFCGIGGIIFRTTEGAFEVFYKCGVKRVKRDFLDTLWDKRYLREDEWKSLARTKLMNFENELYDAYDAGMNSYSGQKGWSFVNSIIYVLTVVTTIGYGHMAPVTTLGRLATIVYSLFGIPMFLILLADYGKLFTRVIKFLWAFVRRLYYTGSCRKVRRTGPVQEMMKGVQMVYDMTTRRGSNKDNSSTTAATTTTTTSPPKISPSCTPALSTYTIDDQFNLPVSVAFGVLLVYMIGGAIFFSYTEGWKVFDAFYFVYISISTIGFGDLVPKSQVFLMLVSLVYFVFGLALTSMCINVIQEKLSDSFKKATAKIGATIGFEVPNDGDVIQYSTDPIQQVFSSPTGEYD